MFCSADISRNDRAETMRACALKVFKIERWKTTTHAVESLIEESRLKVLDCKMLTIANSCTEILITCYTSCSVFFRLSFNGKYIHAKKISYAEMRE